MSKFKFQLIFAFFLVFLLLAAPLIAVDSGSRFSSVSGEVKIFPESNPASKSLAKVQSQLNIDDHVLTEEDSNAIICFAEMSTFLLKAESEIAIKSPISDTSKINLIKGNIWVNVKKISSGGSFEIEGNQTVTGIKGTNVTFFTDEAKTEDRIKVLRGRTGVRVKETHEEIDLEEGEELVVRSGGKVQKSTIDVGEESKEWESELSHLGDSIQLNQVPEIVPQMIDGENKSFKELRDSYSAMNQSGNKDLEKIQKFKHDHERFIGLLLENSVILKNLAGKVDAQKSGFETKKGTKSKDSDQIFLYARIIAQAQKVLQNHRAEIDKMKISGIPEGTVSPESISFNIGIAWSEVEILKSQLESTSGTSGSGGLSQDWFIDAQDRCNITLLLLSEQESQFMKLLEKNPKNPDLLALGRKISDYRVQIVKFMKDLNVVKIDTAIFTEMQDFADQLSYQLSILENAIKTYDTNVANSQTENKLRSTLRILQEFGKSKKIYNQATRLYQSFMRDASRNKYQTSEQAELNFIYQQIADSFDRLGVAYDEIQVKHQELQNQLNQFLK
ncbi:MAG: FecR domain-containing protein [Candidatus Riflebacteria bacterium]|nr:FecR domain-containing protein [Candidatus Riflebacteria bacterium]